MRYDFSNSNFNNVVYNKVNLAGGVFRFTTFIGATITNSAINFTAADNTNFTNANLSNTVINTAGAQYGSLIRSNFFNANLTNTKINYFDANNADFTGANLTGASIINGNLCDAKISPQQLASMTSLSGTVGPDCKTIYK